jgi:hypothetical protein
MPPMPHRGGDGPHRGGDAIDDGGSPPDLDASIIQAMDVPPPQQPIASDFGDEMYRMRREIEALKESMGAAPAAAKKRPKKKAKAKRPAKRT